MFGRRVGVIRGPYRRRAASSGTVDNIIAFGGPMAAPAQSFESHARMVTGYHKVAFGLILIVLIHTIYRTATSFSWDQAVNLVFVVVFVMIALYARLFALGVQDRVIRLEERLRMAELFPPDLMTRIGELTTEQLIALRFASDGELADLTRRVLDEGITDRKTIKAAVESWRPDHQRI